MRLVEVREQYTPTEVADWVAHLPDESATRRAIDPTWRHTVDLEVQRAILLRLDRLVWQNGGGKGDEPQPITFAWEEPDDERPDAMTTQELADWLDDDRLREALGIKG